MQGINSLKKKRVNLKKQFKKILFQTLHYILLEKRISKNYSIVLIVIFYVQLISMNFNTSSQILRNTVISSFLPIFEYSLIFPQLINNQNKIILLILVLLQFLILLYLSLGFLYIYKHKKQEDPNVKEFKFIWAFIFECLDKVFYHPFLGLNLLNLLCFKGANQCFQGIQLILFFVCIINLAMLTFWQLIFALFFSNFTFKVKDSLSTNPSQLNLFDIFFRSLLILYCIVVDISSTKYYNINLVLHFCFGIYKISISLIYFPFHQKTVSKAFGSFSGIYLWITFSLLFIEIINVEQFNLNILLVIGIGLIFFVKLYLNIRNYTIKMLMLQEIKQIEKDTHLDLKIRNYNFLAKTKNQLKKSELVLASLLKIHFDKCINFECPCRNRRFLFDPIKNEYSDEKIQQHKDDIFVKYFIIQMIKDGVDKFSTSQLLHLDLMFYEFENLKSYSHLYYLIEQFKKKFNLGISLEFIIFQLQANLEIFLIHKNKNSHIGSNLNIQNIQSFDEGLIEMKNKIENVNMNYCYFWESLNEQVQSINYISQICDKNLENIQDTIDHYQFLISLNKQSLKFKLLMLSYANFIIFDPNFSWEIENDIKITSRMEIGNSLQQDIEILVTTYNIFDSRAATVSINNSPEKMGYITWMSQNLHGLFEYDSNELILDQPISLLMPKIFANHHNQILQNFYFSGQEVVINNLSHIWGKSSHGNCFSINLFVKVIPHINQYELMGLIHKLNDQDYLLTDQLGILNSMGKKLSLILDFQSKKYEKNDICFVLLVPKLLVYFGEALEQVGLVIKNRNYNQNQQKFQFQKLLKFNVFRPFKLQKMARQFNEDLNKLKKIYVYNNIDQFIEYDSELGIEEFKQYLKFCQQFCNQIKQYQNQIQISKIIKIKAIINSQQYFNGRIIMTSIKILQMKEKVITDKAIAINKINQQKKFFYFYEVKLQKIVKDINIARQQNEKANMILEQQINEQIQNQYEDSRSPLSKQFKFQNSIKNSLLAQNNASKKMTINLISNAINKIEIEQNLNQQTSVKTLQNQNSLKIFQSQRTPMFINQKTILTQKSQQGVEEDDEEYKTEYLTTHSPGSPSFHIKKKRRESQQQSNKNNEDFEEIIGSDKELIQQQLCQEDQRKLQYDPESQKILKKEQDNKIQPKSTSQFLLKLFKGAQQKQQVKKENQKQQKQMAQQQAGYVEIYSSDSFYEDKDDPNKLTFEKDSEFVTSESEQSRSFSIDNQEHKFQKEIIETDQSKIQAFQTIKQTLYKQKSPILLQVSIYFVLAALIIIFIILFIQRDKINTHFKLIKELLLLSRKLQFYHYGMIQIYGQTYIQTNFFHENSHQNEFVQDMIQFLISDLSYNGKLIQNQDLNAYLFFVYKANMDLPGSNQESKIETNFQNFMRTFLNQANFSSLQNSTKENQNFILRNFDILLDISSKDDNFTQAMFSEAQQSFNKVFFTFFILQLSLVSFIFILILPILIVQYLNINQTLIIFTKIPLIDVQFYNDYYKQIKEHLYQNDNYQQMYAWLQDMFNCNFNSYLKHKAEYQDLNRQRIFQGNQFNCRKFVIKSLILLFFLMLILFYKDLIIIQYLKKANHIQQIFFKQLIFPQNFSLQLVKTIKQIKEGNLQNNLVLEKFHLTELFLDIYKEFRAMDKNNYNAFIQNFYIHDICYILDKYSSQESIRYYQKYRNYLQCNNLSVNDKLLIKNPLLNIVQYFYHQVDIIKQNYSKDHINFLLSLFNILPFLKNSYEIWNHFSSQAIENHLTYLNFLSTIMLIIDIIIILAAFLLFWRRIYFQLIKQLKWVKMYMLLIPIMLIRENSHIKYWFKNKLQLEKF